MNVSKNTSRSTSTLVCITYKLQQLFGLNEISEILDLKKKIAFSHDVVFNLKAKTDNGIFDVARVFTESNFRYLHMLSTIDAISSSRPC